MNLLNCKKKSKILTISALLSRKPTMAFGIVQSCPVRKINSPVRKNLRPLRSVIFLLKGRKNLSMDKFMEILGLLLKNPYIRIPPVTVVTV